MKLNDSQMKQVAAWFAAGERLSDIQKRIAEEFGIEMTYLDVRLLVADLPQPEEKTVPEKKDEPPAADAAPAGDGSDDVESLPADDASADEPQPAGGVSVSMSPIAIPGTIAAGSVTFSDGKSGKWYLDDMGRLGLAELPEGYRPPPSDGAAFQRQVVSLLRSKGMV